ncbi:hypothetical protein BATDEDRAFT_28671 [Batrachochytrium dendrobatidis JAM81]|uniref:UDENN domain-containing protein n=1 Tax=Batrachochytrium dendrobatidis (strain JAM81 / FGSC 10211) TaxID=684364 RepID=F4PES0_BATDJ|nr:uncharacterized protein BATDEDRAFT_28671 [Batrachochytrium dendrobatidis JAM81]EGF76293.1 hypothetical protein BATDEDRAFT_28671 [Batrachochytrium dendrobatidis JAM81]|eukprot:XP_006683063.1 hypothetical protein BATDEDRAFT_28671 [Batrachochytrium dendrobatidis JAM81]
MPIHNYTPRISPMAEFVLLAEFDIDKGSSLSCQYPTPTGADPATLAEWMLPEGAHLRREDCSYFILNRTKAGTTIPNESIALAQLQSSPLEQECNQRNVRVLGRIDCVFSSADDRMYFMRFVHESAQVLPAQRVFPEDLPEIPTPDEPLLYVINMISMKIIAGARRSARVKAMAIASRHPWVHPLLILALDKYFSNPSEQVITDLFYILNGVDTRSIPILTLPERKVMRMLMRNTVPHHSANFDQQKIFLKHYDSKDEPLEIRDYLTDPEILINFAHHSLPIKVPVASLPSEFGDFSFTTLFTTFASPTLTNQTLPLKWRNELPYCWHPHLDCGSLTHPIIVLLFALLTEKRVLFLGYGKPSSEISSCVLACTAIASGGGLVPDAISRSFPCVGLASVDMLLKVPGYIAGVTNPVFEEQAAWWDILCNLNTGKITISSRLISNEVPGDTFKDRSFDATQAISEEDDTLIQEISMGLQKHIDEMHLRQLVYNFVERFIQVCTPPVDVSVSVSAVLPGLTTSPPVMPAISGNITSPVVRIPMQWRARAEAWQNTQSMKNLCQSRLYMSRKTMFPQYDVKSALVEMAAVALPNIPGISSSSSHGGSSIGRSSGISTGSGAAILSLQIERVVSNFCIMDYLVQEASDDELMEILSYLPTTDGGCLPFSIGLYHERPEVRMAAAHIIQRLFLQKMGEDDDSDMNYMDDMGLDDDGFYSDDSDSEIRGVEAYTEMSPVIESMVNLSVSQPSQSARRNRSSLTLDDTDV